MTGRRAQAQAVSITSLGSFNCTDRTISCAQLSEFEVMNADPKTATNRPAAYYVGVSQHAFDVPAPSTLVTGVALAYAAVALGLAAHLLFSDGTPSWAAQDPAVSRVTSPAIDPEALTVGFRLHEESGAGSGYLEFVPTGE